MEVMDSSTLKFTRRPTPRLTAITRTPVSDGQGIPQFEFNFPDPTLIWGDGCWRAYSTSSGNFGVPMAVSQDATNWWWVQQDALPDRGQWVDSVDQAIWSPDVMQNDDGTYIMYYTARQQGGNHCIGAAISNCANGPFIPQMQPLISDEANGGVIDPSGFDDGKDRWLMWKVDGNSFGGATTCQPRPPQGSHYFPTPIKIQKLTRDGLQLVGDAKIILDHQGQADDGIVEGPALYKVPNGDFILFFSTHCFASDLYDIQYAWSNTVDGFYTDRGVLLQTTESLGLFGPGNPDIDPNGVNIVFHARPAPHLGGLGPRYLFSASLNFEGRDSVAKGAAADTVISSTEENETLQLSRANTTTNGGIFASMTGLLSSVKALFGTRKSKTEREKEIDRQIQEHITQSKMTTSSNTSQTDDIIRYI